MKNEPNHEPNWDGLYICLECKKGISRLTSESYQGKCVSCFKKTEGVIKLQEGKYYKQVFLINTDLGMRAGKIAVQVAHGETMYMDQIVSEYCKEENTDMYRRYSRWFDVMKKVVLKSNETEMKSIKDELEKLKISFWTVHDAGLTQIPSGSMTCICIEPLEESRADELFGHMKLL